MQSRKYIMKYFIPIVLAMLSSTIMQAQIFQGDLEKGFKALDKNDFPKAIEYFDAELESDSSNAGANYGMAQVYFSKSYSGFNADKAHTYIVQASSDFKSATRKQITTFTKLNVTQNTIDELKLKIDNELFSGAAATYSV